MAWLILVLAGFFESVWAIALGESHGFHRCIPTLIFAVALPVSMVGLAAAMNSLPTATAYAVWVGIGASLTALWGIATGAEPASLARVALLALLVGSVVGLKLVS
ncbi:multidrug efflux SMR transporter [Mycobacterium cookii]|uniref:QacE family quaternary ammonium compound efflux SMR transporter n=1 Tax=Mycobacterium cookii TaxID=1775 RepID=A0A7I7KXD2_9MYCO|nr:SMR family transporter [Mycobacterium cookii]MCV7332815.1 QacE family quaternary ammonium compound efflux SMR transporter [Mycobacterium cookii]BBX46201.1 QacE family quaternary ammonium compound efflux SMR transporter [Mycobacterium cookii]